MCNFKLLPPSNIPHHLSPDKTLFIKLTTHIPFAPVDTELEFISDFYVQIYPPKLRGDFTTIDFFSPRI